jgi:hypothetical protein
MENAGWNQMKHNLLSVNHQCVPGIVAALVTDYGICILRVNIDDFSFTLVAPLGTDYHHVSH